MRDSFSNYHPLVNFFYFAAVIVCAMFFMHPAYLAISFLCAFSYSCLVGRSRAARFNLAFVLPAVVVFACANPLFNHAGATILFYFPSGNPATLESILYGVAAAVMMGSVLLWFSCYNAVMTSDKFIYLFGRILPAGSLLLSMVLRFVPRYKAQFAAVSGAQRCVGRDPSSGSLIERIKNGLTILSILTTWALENGVDTADSMRARGYGLPGRTSFSNFRLDRRDALALSAMAVLAVVVLAVNLSGASAAQYFPRLQFGGRSFWGFCGFAAYFLLCAVPLIVDLTEELRWTYFKSKM